MSALPLNAAEPPAKLLRSPKTTAGRFIAKRTLRSSLILGVILSLYMLIKASSYIKAYPSEIARQKLAESLGGNVGIEALLGVAHRIDTVSGYLTWNFLCLIAATGAIWALVVATKTFRGEEDAGRWELFLAGQTTPRRAAINAFAGLASGLLLLYIVIALAVLSIGRLNNAGFSDSAGLFFSLSLVAGAAEFMAVGAVASQLMPVRSRAAGVSAAVFGLFYMVRLIADSTTAHWLLNFSPLGWIERLQPMYNARPMWLLPIGGFVIVLIATAVWLAGRRDLYEGIVADKDTATPKTSLLHSPLAAVLRLNCTVIAGWLAAVAAIAFLYGELAKSAAQIVDSASVKPLLSRLAQSAHTQAVLTFLGFTFFFVTLVIMVYVANALGRMRSDEANGYLDNFLVRPLSRLRWLSGRVLLIVLGVIVACLISAVAAWAGEASQHVGVSIRTLLLAGANNIAPTLLVLGIGVFAYGIIPRLTSLLAYGAIGWSFLVTMLSSGLNINHWLLDTSIFHQVALAPAVNANWSTDAVLLIVGLVLGVIGAVRFNQRDLQGD
jgi:ABC-2 type transport system permease protein